MNALKGVSEVVIKAALKKLGVDPNSIKLLAIPFPSMRAALNNGQVDAIHVPEPFLDPGPDPRRRPDVLAPGPTLGNYWPNGGYAALSEWIQSNPALAKNFRLAMNESVRRAVASGRDPRAPAGGIAEHRLASGHRRSTARSCSRSRRLRRSST